MSALIGMLGSIWPALVGVFGLLAGMVVSYLGRKSAQVQVAQAAQKAAEADAAMERAKAQTAAVRDAESQANASAAMAGAQSMKERANVENDVASLPAGAAAEQLRNEWSAGNAGSSAAGSAGKDESN
ncbi:hypothetical protein [Bordetella genomosp. 9]|uniref:hypothetical protein n=1 Tax=Bordetella genomosp. 9 TaxID=1416803 RepID=UPI0012FCA78A|nr:hypothetical protein [Bordetella genomosp. 9]